MRWIKDTFEQYRAMPGINAHSIPYLLRSPNHYKAMKSAPEKESDALSLGRLVHMLLLEPENEKNIVLAPEGDKRTKSYREAFTLFEESLLEGSIVATAELLDKAKAIRDKVKSHPTLPVYLHEARCETSGYLECPEFELQIKLRPDAVKNWMIADIKTTKDASLKSFQRDIVNYGYDIHAAFYHHYTNVINAHTGYDQISMDNYYWIAIENEAPYEVMIWRCDSVFLERGWEKCKQALNAYKMSQLSETGSMGYDILPNIMRAPAWY